MTTLKKFSAIQMLLLLGLVSILATGCKKEGCIDPNAINYDPDAKDDDGSCQYNESKLMMHFHPKAGSADFAYNTTYAVNGRNIKFTRAQFYFSGLKLETDVGGELAVDKYLLVNAATHMYEIGAVTPGHYHGLEFNVGVDSVANHSDPSTYAADHALSNMNDNVKHWSWNSGYIFIALEGMVDTSAAGTGNPDVDFQMHVGTDNLLRMAHIHGNHFDIESGQNYTLELEWDILRFLDGVNLQSDYTTHTMNNMPLATTIADNARDNVFSAE